jgi:hypothetical protein
MGLRKIEWNGVDCIDLTEHRMQRRALGKTAMKLRAS